MERQKDKDRLKKLDKYSIYTVYILMFFGGLWQILGLFQEFNQMFAGLLLILLSSFIFFISNQYHNLLNKENKLINRNLYFFIFIVAAGFIIEFIGVKTGYIFGVYYYGDVLKPQISDVPIAIGFAWHSTLMASAGLIQKFSKINHRMISNKAKAVIVGLLMMYFDILLEPAAVALNYWSWQNSIVPIQNYIAWFVIGYLFAFVGYKTDILNNSLPKFVFHSYFAQIIYFVMIYLK